MKQLETVKLTIDGKEVTARKGLAIMQAARSVGIEIPHLCYHERLSATGACRMCVVEVKGAKALVTSCTTPVSEGMEVLTQSERTRKARRVIIELLVSNHPLDCMTCELSGCCKLQDYAYEYGVKGSRFAGEKAEFPIQDENGFIVRDYSKCILCGRCVLACAEVRYRNVIDFTGRGFSTKIAAPYDGELAKNTCEFCGECVAVCPVGALTERPRIGAGREWDLKKVRTVCPYCGVGCVLELSVADNRIVRSTAPEGEGPNKGSLCVKGRFGLDFVGHPDRLMKPLVRRNGKLVESTWDEALDLVAGKLSKIRKNSGPDSIGFFSSAKATNEENYIFQKFARAVVGTNNVDHCAHL
jgi:predicted molibdopterin-dependent oxidoreductase YjgC